MSGQPVREAAASRLQVICLKINHPFNVAKIGCFQVREEEQLIRKRMGIGERGPGHVILSEDDVLGHQDIGEYARAAAPNGDAGQTRVKIRVTQVTANLIHG